MARSPAFARLTRDLLRLVDAIPAGQVATQQDLGDALDIPPRHVAYILSSLKDEALRAHPWHRVVGRDGHWPHRHAGGADRCRAEGLPLHDGRIGDWADRRVDVSRLRVTLEAATRPEVYARRDGSPALSEARGIGPRSLALLQRLGITTLPALKSSDPIDLFARARALEPGVSLNLLYALVGAIEDRDWREVARQDRTSLLMVLEERGLLH